ncbi:SDR family NAD(P)-dependent oxidoreductase [Parasphingorhabdus sp.]|uniref:SDR family NAD(P)-dependent oxidoreductase n=1 Tax=Parasphingorhabdus sp. TaxID=2709688 RepID=UPI00359428B5
MDFTGKTAVITGGATGIGFALAKHLGRAGARIILFEPRETQLQEAVTALGQANIDAKYLVGDVTSAEQVEALADFAWAENGRGDIIINNAGIGGSRASVLDAEPDDIAQVYNVNFFGLWNGIRTFGKRFREDGQPSAIYSTASENALFNALPSGGAAYVSGKHAVFGLMEVLRREAHPNIELGVIIPGWVATPMTRDMGMDADEFASIIFRQMQAGEYYLVSHAYNMVRFDERYDELKAAFGKYAPRYDGDDEYDVQKYFARMQAARKT